jgi:hypothetical protein
VVRNGLCAATLTLLVLTGCAARGDSAAAPVDPGPVRPAAGGAALAVDVQNPDQPMVLDALPAGLVLQQLQSMSPDGGYQPYGAALYGDPDIPDTLDGPVLLLGTSTGSANLGGPPSGPPGDRRVDLGGRDGWIVHEKDRTWLGVGGYDGEHVEFLVGRGIDEEALITAARGADFDTPTPTLIAGAVPEGLAPLIAGSPGDGPYAGPAGERVVLSGDDGTVIISAVRADPRLATLWGFWTDDAVGTAVRGRAGSRGDMHGIYWGRTARGDVWAEDGLVLSVIGLSGGARYVDQVVRDLRRGTPAELEAMRRSGIERQPTAEDIGCRAGTPVVTGVDGDLRWGIGVQPSPDDPGGWSDCLRLITLDGAPNAVSGSWEPPPVGQLGVTSVGTGEGVATFGSDVLIGGVAPPGTVRVAVTDTAGRRVDAVLAEHGPRPGEKLFGAFLRGVPVVMNGSRLAVTAYDAGGAVLDTEP